MKKTTFESLPNELLRHIFGYLSSFDLCRAFLDGKNTRIEHLLTCMRHSLNVSSMHYDQLGQWLSNSNNDITKRFTSLIETLVLRDTPGCWLLFSHWRKTLNDPQQCNMLLPSIKRLFILNPDRHEYALIKLLRKPGVFRDNILQYLHLVFDTPSVSYFPMLAELMSYRISVHTLILEIEKGHKFDPRRFSEDLYKVQSFCWPNTVRLTLSIQHSDELMLLLQRGALPAMEHLNITNEEVRFAFPRHEQKPRTHVQLCEDILRQKADATRLRSLVLRYMSISDVIIFIGSLTMPLLDKLILVDLYDHTLDYLGKFQELCRSTHLPSLRDLHFSFCFPQEIEHAWRTSSFNCNDEWPFNNIGFHMDESVFFSNTTSDFTIKSQFVIYKRPIYAVLQHKRTLHNHHFAAHVSVPIITTQRRTLEMTCDQMDNPEQLFNTLQLVASSHVNKLYLGNLRVVPHVLMTPNYPAKCDLLFYHLRSMIFNFESELLKRSDRLVIVRQILDASPNISHLTIEWKDFRHCLQTYSNLTYVHLVLDRVAPEPKQHFNVRRLNKLAPRLRCLETSNAIIMFNENLVQFILKIIRRFDQLVYLILNKDCLYPFKQEKKMMFIERLLAAGQNQFFDCNKTEIRFYGNGELCVWL